MHKPESRFLKRQSHDMSDAALRLSSHHKCQDYIQSQLEEAFDASSRVRCPYHELWLRPAQSHKLNTKARVVGLDVARREFNAIGV